MVTIRKSDISMGEALELGMLVGFGIQRTLDGDETARSKQLQAKLYNQAAPRKIYEEIGNGICTALPVGQNAPKQSAAIYVDSLISGGTIVPAAGNFILKLPLIGPGKSDDYSTDGWSLISKSGPPLSNNGKIDLISATKKLGELGLFKTSSAGILEPTAEYTGITTLGILMHYVGHRMDDISSDFHPNITSFMETGVIKLNGSGIIDVVPEKLKEFLSGLEIGISNIHNEDFNRDAVLGLINRIRQTYL